MTEYIFNAAGLSYYDELTLDYYVRDYAENEGGTAHWIVGENVLVVRVPEPSDTLASLGPHTMRRRITICTLPA